MCRHDSLLSIRNRSRVLKVISVVLGKRLCCVTMRAKTATCSNCEALAAEVADLRASVALLKEQVATLKEELAKAKKDSSTSSKPPSSDIINPDKKTAKGKRRRGKRKQGGQPGHPRHERPEFPPEVLDDVWEYSLSVFPACGST